MKTLLTMVLAIVFVGSSEAQTIYRYVDEKGQVHMTDDPNKIPKAKGGKGEVADDPRQPPPHAVEPTPPRIRNIETPGNLESKYDLGCVTSEKLNRKHTPADLYKAAARCLDSDRYSEAVFLFAQAGAYGRFDRLRVQDTTAHQALTVLIMQTIGSRDLQKRERWNEHLTRTLGDPQRLAAVCKEVVRIGPPDYYPRYMIQHGMDAVLAFVDPGNARTKGVGDGLVKGFDARAAWKQSLDTYLHCPGLEKTANVAVVSGSAEPRLWVSKKWGYEITCPATWEYIATTDASVTGPADVMCGDRRTGVSTAVFAYPRDAATSIDNHLSQILNQYRQLLKGKGKDLEVVERVDIRRGTAVGTQVLFHAGDTTHLYAILLGARTKLGISSNAPRALFVEARKDFDSIVASVKFQ